MEFLIALFFFTIGIIIIISRIRSFIKKKKDKRISNELLNYRSKTDSIEPRRIGGRLFDVDKSLKLRLATEHVEMVCIIEEFFEITKCIRCNEMVFKVVKFNSQFNSFERECLSCQKRSWVISDKSINTNLIYKYYDFKQLIKQIVDLCWNDPEFDESNDIFDLEVCVNTIDETISTNNNRKTISTNVKKTVWNRDNGQCVECGSKENIEYDHIIPVSKGGSNTARNLQLLCEKCNRMKGAEIQ